MKKKKKKKPFTSLFYSTYIWYSDLLFKFSNLCLLIEFFLFQICGWITKYFIYFHLSCFTHSFEIQPIQGWNSIGLIKNRKNHDLVWPGKPRTKTRLQPVDFFLSKRRCFDFFLKYRLTRPTRSPDQDPEPGSWTGPGLKTMVLLLLW
jgi:hypothetical protein